MYGVVFHGEVLFQVPESRYKHVVWKQLKEHPCGFLCTCFLKKKGESFFLVILCSRLMWNHGGLPLGQTVSWVYQEGCQCCRLMLLLWHRSNVFLLPQLIVSGMLSDTHVREAFWYCGEHRQNSKRGTCLSLFL